MALTRRQLLKAAATTTAALGVPPLWHRRPGTNVAWAAGPSDAIVVFVRMYGGNDGINTVYPLGGPQRAVYETARPTLQLPAQSADMQPWVDGQLIAPGTAPRSIGSNVNGSSYAFHPTMGAMHRLYQDGALAVVHGVHYPFPDHSHFRSEVIWYTGDPLGNAGLGWFGRYLDLAGFPGTQVPGVLLGDDLVPIFTPTATGLLVFNRLDELVFPADDDTAARRTAFLQLYAQSQLAGALRPELAVVGTTGSATVQAIGNYYRSDPLAPAGRVEALLLDTDGAYDADNPLVYASPLNPVDNPSVRGMQLARDLKHVAATIRADVGARFFHVAIGGFDTHTNQEQAFFHSLLLREVSESVAAFYDELNRSVTLPGGYTGYRSGNLAPKVLIVTFSEFGRTIRQNAYNRNAAGTDHGTSSPHFVLGGTVLGGQYGAAPLLDDPGAENEDDLKMTHDFRDLFGTVLTRWLGVSTAAVGPGPSAIFPANATPDADGNTYTAFTPIPFLAP